MADKRVVVHMTSDTHIGKATPVSQREMDQASLSLALDHVDDARRIVTRVANRLVNKRDTVRAFAGVIFLNTAWVRLKELAEQLDSDAAEREELYTPSSTTTVVSLGDALEPPKRTADNS